MTDVRQFLLTLSVLLLVLCLVGCISTHPAEGLDSVAPSEGVTKDTTEAVTQTEPVQEPTEPISEQVTENVSEQATEEETTYGELHFPESEN